MGGRQIIRGHDDAPTLRTRHRFRCNACRADRTGGRHDADAGMSRHSDRQPTLASKGGWEARAVLHGNDRQPRGPHGPGLRFRVSVWNNRHQRRDHYLWALGETSGHPGFLAARSLKLRVI
jgi:hypothetical protein